MTGQLPTEVPVMTLPNTVFFPRTVLPLIIFEPRYRHMLRDVLAGNRLFAVAALDSGTAGGTEEFEPPSRIATVGVIRACQKNENGTSNLLLEGLARIEILGIVRERPYRLIRVRPLPDHTDAGPGTLGRLRRELLRVIEVRSKLGLHLPADLEIAVREIGDPAALCDLLVFSMIRDPAFQQMMLETIDTASRLRQAIERLRRETDLYRLHRRLQGTLDDDDIGHN